MNIKDLSLKLRQGNVTLIRNRKATMKTEDFIKAIKEGKIKLIGHRAGYLMTPYPENSLESFKHIFENEELLNATDGFEFDVCFTKDHIPVVIHDKYIDDISNARGLINQYTLEELKQFTFGFRKSLNDSNGSFGFRICTLEELLRFFDENISSLKNRIIKIETKDYIFTNKDNFSCENLEILADIINKFPRLAKNIVHLSFWPLNFLFFRKIQERKGYTLIKNDLLCDYSILVLFSRFMPYLDNVSLRVKTNQLAQVDANNSNRVNKKIQADLFWMRLSNAIKEKNLRYAISRYGSVGLYTINTTEEIEEFCKHVSPNFFDEISQQILVTTDNPILMKSMSI